MKKPNRQRDMLLQRKREALRLHRKVKPERDGHSGQRMEIDRPGFNIFAWFNKVIPRLRKEMDERDRIRIARRRGQI